YQDDNNNNSNSDGNHTPNVLSRVLQVMEYNVVESDMNISKTQHRRRSFEQGKLNELDFTAHINIKTAGYIKNGNNNDAFQRYTDSNFLNWHLDHDMNGIDSAKLALTYYVVQPQSGGENNTSIISNNRSDGEKS